MEKPRYIITEINKIINGALISSADPYIEIKDIAIDSRRLSVSDNTIFFAFVTSRNDGHKYISQCYQKGIRNFVVSNYPENMDEMTDTNIILVKDTLKAIQLLATAHRKNFSIPVIGITGSNGKTVVKEWIYQILFERNNIVRSPKSYNSQIGVPLSIWQMKSHHELGIIEAGISKPGEMDNLKKMIQPTIGIFTNIGHAHDENFHSTEQKINEKLKLFTEVKTLIYCRDNPEIHEQIMQSDLSNALICFTWGHDNSANLRILEIKSTNGATSINAAYCDNIISINIPFTDNASIENAIHCWATLLFLGYANDYIASKTSRLAPIAMRLELKEGVNNCSLINDSYSSDLDSLGIALDFLNQQKQHEKKTVILSDILQSGKLENMLYAEVADLLKNKQIDRVVGIGRSISIFSPKFEIEKEFYASTQEFLNKYTSSMFQNESILLKGARVFEFEKISNLLQKKTHETVLEINLNALVNNLNFYRSLIDKSTKIMVMVKAFSYGSGSYEIANILQFHGVDYLAVAYTDEGIELRKAGINMPIMVMNPDAQSYESLLQHNLEPEIYNFRIFRYLEEIIERNFNNHISQIPVHIKLDTGMHRLGFEKPELEELLNRINENPRIIIRSVFSHLAASDDPRHDRYSRKQIILFESMIKKIRSKIKYPFLIHLLNSSGISRFPEASYDMVRLGIGLYGISSDPAEQKMLANVSTLKSIVSQIKSVEKNETIGYDRAWKAKRKTSYAIIPIGYADGLNRRLGNNKGKVLINGKFVPIIGNICMDMCMADITDAEVKEGDKVIIFGEGYPVLEFARDLGTIPYEVLTTISRRVKRIYFYE